MQQQQVPRKINSRQFVSMAEGKRYAFSVKEDLYAYMASKGVGANYAEGKHGALMENREAGAHSAVARGSAYMERFVTPASCLIVTLCK